MLGHFHGQKSLAGYSLKGHKESGVTEAHVLTELVELAAEFQERARESIQAWLVQL